MLFTDANLNQLGSIMTKIGRDIGGSSDLILKVDTDEFLTVHDNSTNTLTASLSDYLSGFAKNEKHPLRLVDNSKVGYTQKSMPSKEVCKKDIYSTPEQFSLGPIHFAGNGHFKMVYESKQMAMGRTHIGLGGHAFPSIILIGPSSALCIITFDVWKLRLKIVSEFLKGIITSVPLTPTSKPNTNWRKCLNASPKICATLVISQEAL